MCPEMWKRRVSWPARGMAPSDMLPCGNSSVGDAVQGTQDKSALSGDPDACVTLDSDESLDSEASDIEHYLYEPIKDHHPIFTSSESESDSDEETAGG
jgi:hypothetical protein